MQTTRSAVALDTKGLHVPLPGGRQAYFNYFWLRDNCPTSFSPTTREPSFDIFHLDQPTQAESADVEGEHLVLRWARESHTTRMPLAALARYAGGERRTDSADLPRKAWFGDHSRELVRMRWGLVPFFWSKPLKEVPATFNARAETAHEKPMFRDAFRKQRCIVPMSGFYEWTGEKGSKTPQYFSAANVAPVLAVAGLRDRWKDKQSGEEMQSCTIVVSGASAWLAPYHDRMPVLLTGDEIENWLTGKASTEALRPAAEAALREWIVSSRVYRTGVGDDDPSAVG